MKIEGICSAKNLTEKQKKEIANWTNVRNYCFLDNDYEKYEFKNIRYRLVDDKIETEFDFISEEKFRIPEDLEDLEILLKKIFILPDLDAKFEYIVVKQQNQS